MDAVGERARYLVLCRRQRVERVLPDRGDPLAFTDEQLYARYRFRRPTLLFLFDLLTPAVIRTTHRNGALSVPMVVLTALQFFATGSYYWMVGLAMEGTLSKAEVCYCVHTVAVALEEMAERFIGWEDMARTRAVFRQICGFPDVVGCVDGTLIPILRPTEKYAFQYMCRKHFYALNVQVISDDRYRICDVVVDWPGSTHDSRIWRNSGIREEFASGRIDGMLFGDSGYPTEPWLMTPYRKPPDAPRRRFNRRLSSVRVKVEQTFGIAKRRFPCISQPMRVETDSATAIIITVFVLHNISIDMGDILPADIPRVEDLPPPDPIRRVRPMLTGLATRLALVQTHCMEPRVTR